MSFLLLNIVHGWPAAVGQPSVNRDYRNGEEPADHQIKKKERVAQYQEIFVKDVDYRIIYQEKAKDKTDYPPLFFKEHILVFWHRLFLVSLHFTRS